MKVENVEQVVESVEDKKVENTEVEKSKNIEEQKSQDTEDKKAEKFDNKGKGIINRKFEKFKDLLINTRLFTIFIGIIILLKTLLFYKVVLKIELTNSVNTQITEIALTIYTILAFIGIFLILPMLLKNRMRFLVTMLIDFLISLLLFADDVYYGYSSNLVSFSQISNLRYGREISIALPNLIHFTQIFYFIDIIVIIVLVILKKIKINKYAKYRFWPGLVYGVIIISLIPISVKGWIENARRTPVQ